MKRITLVLGVVAVMVVMLVALAAPAMAKHNGGHNKGRAHGKVLEKKRPGTFRVPDGANQSIVPIGFF